MSWQYGTKHTNNRTVKVTTAAPGYRGSILTADRRSGPRNRSPRRKSRTADRYQKGMHATASSDHRGMDIVLEYGLYRRTHGKRSCCCIAAQPSAVVEASDSPLRNRWRMSDTFSALVDSALLLQLNCVSEQASELASSLASSAGRALIAHDPTGCISLSHALSAVAGDGAAGRSSPARWPRTGEDGRLSASSFSESEASPGLLLEWNSSTLLLLRVGSMSHVRRWPSTRRTGVVKVSTMAIATDETPQHTPGLFASQKLPHVASGSSASR